MGLGAPAENRIGQFTLNQKFIPCLIMANDSIIPGSAFKVKTLPHPESNFVVSVEVHNQDWYIAAAASVAMVIVLLFIYRKRLFPKKKS